MPKDSICSFSQNHHPSHSSKMRPSRDPDFVEIEWEAGRVIPEYGHRV